MAKPTILVIDMLNEFVTGELAFDLNPDVVPRLRNLLAGAREAGIPIAFACDAHDPSDPEMALWGEHAMAGTPGAEIIPELAPHEGEHRVAKRTYSAFHDTGLAEHLQDRDIDTVLLTGIHTHICVQHAAADAFFSGFRVVVVSDCVDAFTPEEHQEGLDFMVKMYDAELVTSDELLSSWKEAAA